MNTKILALYVVAFGIGQTAHANDLAKKADKVKSALDQSGDFGAIVKNAFEGIARLAAKPSTESVPSHEGLHRGRRSGAKGSTVYSLTGNIGDIQVLDLYRSRKENGTGRIEQYTVLVSPKLQVVDYEPRYDAQSDSAVRVKATGWRGALLLGKPVTVYRSHRRFSSRRHTESTHIGKTDYRPPRWIGRLLRKVAKVPTAAHAISNATMYGKKP